MKTLLYVTANSKDEQASSCKTVGRRLVNAMMQSDPDMQLQELDLYKDHIPQLKGHYFESRSVIVSGEARSKLDRNDQKEVQRIEDLCNQFCDADLYVLAAPMWSLSFPAPVKEYLDCIIQSGKTIAFESSQGLFENNKPHGLLGNKHRVFIYVQSSGADIPWILRSALNKGLNYVEDIVKFIGIDTFEELLVDGTGTTEAERQEAIQSATEKISDLVAKL